MGTEELRGRVIDLVAKVLQAPAQTVGPDGRIDVTPNWSSLTQLGILTLIEQEFGVTIEPEDAVDLTSVSALTAFLDKGKRP
jgi:acyl carrier protein